MSSREAPLLEALNLQALLLDECHVVRGDADDSSPGSVESDIAVEFIRQEDIIYFVRSSHKFKNNADALLVQIDATFMAVYSLSGLVPADEDLEEFGENALMIQVLPFLREFLATMTNRLAIPTFYLPVFKRGADLLWRGAAARKGDVAV